MDKYAVILAAGKGTRMKTDLPKQFLLLNNKPVLMHTITQFYNCDKDIKIVVVLSKCQIELWKKLCSQYNFLILHKIVQGGKERYDSVKNSLEYIPNNSLVAIHDGVRPLISKTIILNSFSVAKKKESAITVVPLKDSIREKKGKSTVSKNRNQYFLVQTPQTFNTHLLKNAYLTTNSAQNFTDDASVFEASKREITLIEGDNKNIKITTFEDLIIAQVLKNSL